MIRIVVPTATDVLDMQQREGAPYFSLACEDVLRRAGLVSVETMSADDLVSVKRPGVVVVTRGTALPELTEGLAEATFVLEPPVHPVTAATLGIEARETRAFSALHVGHREQRWRVVPRRFRIVRASDPLVSAETTVPDPWSSVRRTPFGHDGEAVPIPVPLFSATARERCWLLAFDVFDLVGSSFGTPPLPGRYAGKEETSGLSRFGATIADELLRILPSDSAAVRIGTWPVGHRAAFTVRHDWDRVLDDSAVDDLVALHARCGVRASVAVLSYTLQPTAVQRLLAAGHEILHHVHEGDADAIARNRSLIERLGGCRMRGANFHGGSSGIGFVGDPQFDWLLRAGFEYAENFSVHGVPAPCWRIPAAGRPERSKLLLTPKHASLDVGTRPNAHRGDSIREALESTLADHGWAILMNHPDLHREALATVLESLDLTSVWRATCAEICDWFRITHFDSFVRLEPDAATLRFPRELPASAVLELHRGGVVTRVVAEAGAREARIPMPIGNAVADPSWTALLLTRTLATAPRDAQSAASTRPLCLLLQGNEEPDAPRDGCLNFFRSLARSELLALPCVVGTSVLGEGADALSRVLPTAIAVAAGRPTSDASANVRSFADWLVETVRQAEAKGDLRALKELGYMIGSGGYRSRAFVSVLSRMRPGGRYGHFVDVGAALGINAWLLAHDPSLHVDQITMVEPLPRYADGAEALWSRTAGREWRVERSTAESLALRSRADVLLASQVLFRLAPEAMFDFLARTREMLQPGGILVLNEITREGDGSAPEHDAKHANVHLRRDLLRALEPLGTVVAFHRRTRWMEPTSPWELDAPSMGADTVLAVRLGG